MVGWVCCCFGSGRPPTGRWEREKGVHAISRWFPTSQSFMACQSESKTPLGSVSIREVANAAIGDPACMNPGRDERREARSPTCFEKIGEGKGEGRNGPCGFGSAPFVHFVLTLLISLVAKSRSGCTIQSRTPLVFQYGRWRRGDYS